MPEEQVSHDELDAAHDAATEQSAEEEGNEEGVEAPEVEESEEVEEQETLPDEPSSEPGENQEKSQLGRKVKAIGDGMQGMQEMLQLLIHQNQQANAPKPEPEEEEEDDIVMKKDIPKHIAKHEQKQQTALKNYNNDFANRVLDLGRDLSDDEFDGITKIIDTDFQRYTNKSGYDALINFNAAKAKYYQKKTAKVNPLDKNKGKVVENLGGKTSTKTTPRTNLKKPTDKVAQQLIKDMGLSDEFVDAALSKPLPTNLGGTG